MVCAAVVRSAVGHSVGAAPGRRDPARPRRRGDVVRRSRSRTFTRRATPARSPTLTRARPRPSTAFETFASPDGPTRLAHIETLMRMARRARPAESFAALKAKSDADRSAMLAKWAAEGIDLPAARPSPQEAADEALRRAKERGDATGPSEPERPADGVDRPDRSRPGESPMTGPTKTQRRREAARRAGMPPPSVHDPHAVHLANLPRDAEVTVTASGRVRVDQSKAARR